MVGRIGLALAAVVVTAGCTASSGGSTAPTAPSTRPPASTSTSAVNSPPVATTPPSVDTTASAGSTTRRSCPLTLDRFAAAVGPGWTGGASEVDGVCGYRRGELAISIGESVNTLSPTALSQRVATLCRISALKPVRRSTTAAVCAGERAILGYVLTRGLNINVNGNKIGPGDTFEVLTAGERATLVTAVEKALDALAS